MRKFGGMSTQSMPNTTPVAIIWSLDWDSKHYPEQIFKWKWRLHSQEVMIIPPDTSSFIHTNFGVTMSLDVNMLMISLANDTKL